MKHEIEITLSAVLGNLETFLSFIVTQAQKAKLSREKINKLELAAEEALVNIIKHAYPSNKKDNYIKIKCKDNNSFVLEIIDEGIPFNPLNIREPNLNFDIETRPIGGVGILLIKKMVDFVEYKRQDNNNLLRLIMQKSH